jgi:NADH dehydrogenase [ubiquinone] 1 alpha subcomplex assembly factor 7
VNALGQKIARTIASDGPLSVATFMTMALHDAQHGFYATRESIGAAGAFITAPEISQIFGELLGLWCVQTWCDQNRPARPRLVELGPGRGTLMADALRAMQIMPEFLADLDTVLVEASPRLAGTQRERLQAEGVPLRWVRQWADVPTDRPLFLLANEFLDALPVRQFVRTERGWCERMVALDDRGALTFALSPSVAPLTVPAERGIADIGAVTEKTPAAEALVADVAQIISDRGGAALFIDYGYDAGTGFGETLQAVGHHRATDMLSDPGEADLSAHVDFAAVTQSAGRARAYGPATQRAFLSNLGIAARAERLSADNPARAEEIATGVERLLNPSAMGTLFKAFALAPTHAPQPPGF